MAVFSWLYEAVFDSPFEVTAETSGADRDPTVWAVTPFAMITFFAGLQTFPRTGRGSTDRRRRFLAPTLA